MSFTSRASDVMIERFGIDVVRHRDYKRCHRRLINAALCSGVGLGTSAAGLGLALVGDYEAGAACLVALLALIPISWYMRHRFDLAAAAEATA